MKNLHFDENAGIDIVHRLFAGKYLGKSRRKAHDSARVV
jgi:hypothetical protein